MKIRIQILLLIITQLIPISGYALNVQLFHPVMGQLDQGLNVYGSQGLRNGNTQLGVYMNWVNDPLEFTYINDNQVDKIVKNFYTANFLFSYGFSDRFTFHFDLPFNVYSEVEPISSYESNTDQSMGDLRFSGTLNLFRKNDPTDPDVKRAGFALIPFLTIPMNNEDDFFGDSSLTGGGLFALDWNLSKRHYLALNLGAQFRERERILNLVIAHQMIASGSYVYRLSCRYRVDLLAEIQSSTVFRKFYIDETTSPVEAFFGLRKQSQSRHLEWNIGIGRGINNGYGAPDFHAFTGISYLFFNRNKPRKHCCDTIVQPIAVVEQQKQIEQKLGSLHIEVVNSNGEAVVTSIQIKKNEIMIVENDTNRIKQPIEAGDYQVILPEQKITESIPVIADQETYKKIVIPVAVPVQAETIVRYIEPIYFDSNKDTIKPESYKALDDVYSIILEFPTIENLQIEAHTDSQGKDVYNLDLSNRRAQAAKEYLIRKGVGKAQIKTIGFGEVRPIEPNETLEGRAKNRRVEFLIQAPNQNIKILQKTN